MVVGIGLAPLLLGGLLGWKRARPEVLEASLIRADRIEVNVGEGYECSIGATTRTGSNGERVKTGPYVTMNGEKGSTNLEAGSMFMTHGKGDDTMDTQLMGGQISMYPNAGGGPSAWVGARKEDAGLRVFPFSMARTSWIGNTQMLVGTQSGLGGLFFSGPERSPIAKLTEPLTPPRAGSPR